MCKESSGSDLAACGPMRAGSLAISAPIGRDEFMIGRDSAVIGYIHTGLWLMMSRHRHTVTPSSKLTAPNPE